VKNMSHGWFWVLSTLLASGGFGPGCKSGGKAQRDNPPEDSSPPDQAVFPALPLFESPRKEDSIRAFEKVQVGLGVVRGHLGLVGGDPIRLNGLFRAIGLRGGLASEEEKAHAGELLANFAQIESYIQGLVKGVVTLEAISTAVAASHLVAYLENTAGEPGAKKSDTLGEPWRLLSESLQVSPTVATAMPLVLVGAECGESPPAAGNLPPTDAEELSDGVVAAATSVLSGQTIVVDGSGKEYRPFLRAYFDRLQWYAKRRSPNAPEHDLPKLVDAYLQRAKEILAAIQKLPSYAPRSYLLAAAPAPDRFSLKKEHTALLGALRHRIQYGAEIPQAFVQPIGGTSSLLEYAFHLVNNDPDVVDGRLWPILWGNAMTMEGAVPGGWLQVVSPEMKLLSVDFDIKRFSRPFDHLDYRVRRMGQKEILGSARHDPRGGQIELGHAFNLTAFAPTEASYETWVVHLVAMDEANHPSEGSCSFVNFHFLPAPPPGSEDDPSQIGLLQTLDPMPPMPYDTICDDWEMGSADPFGLPPRNAFIRRSSGGYLWVEPETLLITRSGESLYINNADTVAHRFATTSNSHFGILGAIGGNERKLDTGAIPPGGKKLLQLPTGLPSTYWFNLSEVTTTDGGLISGVKDGGLHLHILSQNMDCLRD